MKVFLSTTIVFMALPLLAWGMDCGSNDLDCLVEEAQQQVRDIYCRVLFREADPAGLEMHANLLVLSDWTVKQVVWAFASSSEFESRFVQGRSTTDVITTLYDALLARPLDANGVAAWSNVAETQGYRAAVDGFMDSPEYTSTFGDDLVPGGGRPGCGAKALPPTEAPTPAPTVAPTPATTRARTVPPTPQPTPSPTPSPTPLPTRAPTATPPTPEPTATPTTRAPTATPTTPEPTSLPPTVSSPPPPTVGTTPASPSPPPTTTTTTLRPTEMPSTETPDTPPPTPATTTGGAPPPTPPGTTTGTQQPTLFQPTLPPDDEPTSTGASFFYSGWSGVAGSAVAVVAMMTLLVANAD